MSLPEERRSFRPTFSLTPFRACVFVVLLWAGIYLPGLGILQLQHEEPRRALPALHMLASGDWLVPRVGSEPYLRKPPLLNWAIAASCRLSGGVSEWAVRLPSVLATLALAIVMVAVAGPRWLGAEGGLIAATFFLVNLTMIETGRLAELEAIYISVTGIALVLWMTSWRRETGSWTLWLLPAPFLALGMLTKGPTHLIFYYGIVVPVLLFGRNARALLHPAHLLSLILVVGALFCWAIPCSLAVSGQNPIGVWRFWWGQLASRAYSDPEQHFRFSAWLLNGPQTLKNFLPWTLLLPLLWRRETLAMIAGAAGANPRDLALFKGARFGMVVTTILMVLLPKGSPRYIYPLIVVPCLLLGRALSAEAGLDVPRWLGPIWRRSNLLLLSIVSVGVSVTPFLAPGNQPVWSWILIETFLVAGLWWLLLKKTSPLSFGSTHDPDRPASAALTTGTITAIAMMTFAAIIMPRIDTANQHRPREMAKAIRSALPEGAQVWVLEDTYRPFWYYLEPKVRYFRRLTDLPPEAQYILLPASQTKTFLQNLFWQNVPPTLIIQIVDNEKRKFDLLARSSNFHHPS